MPVPEANAEIQSNIDRMRIITHANAKKARLRSSSSTPRWLAWFSDGIVWRFESFKIPFSSTSFASNANEPLQIWSGPLPPLEFSNIAVEMRRNGGCGNGCRQMDVNVDRKRAIL